jgi:hypothetical protein
MIRPARFLFSEDNAELWVAMKAPKSRNQSMSGRLMASATALLPLHLLHPDHLPKYRYRKVRNARPIKYTARKTRRGIITNAQFSKSQSIH